MTILENKVTKYRKIIFVPILFLIEATLVGCVPSIRPDQPMQVWAILRWKDASGGADVGVGEIIGWDRNSKICSADALFQDESATHSETVSRLHSLCFDITKGAQQRCAQLVAQQPTPAGGFVGEYNLCVQYLGRNGNTFYLESTRRSRHFGENAKEVTMRDQFSVTFDVPCRAHLISASKIYPNAPDGFRTVEESCKIVIAK